MQQAFGSYGLHWWFPLKLPNEKVLCDGINWKLRKYNN